MGLDEFAKKETGFKAKGPLPDFKGKVDIAAWISLDKNNQKYLSVQVGGPNGIHFNLFQNKPKTE